MRYWSLVVLSTLAFWLSAGVLAAAPPATDDPAPGAAMDVLVWTAYSGPSLDWLTEQLAVFGRASGYNISIEQYTLGELRKQVVLTDGEERTADLLVGVPHDELAELVELGLLADVTTYATDAYLSDLPAEASSAFTYGRALFGLPLTLEGPALIVNTELVRELPGTYPEFMETAVRLDRGSTSGFRFDFGNFYFAWAWLRSHGAKILEPATGGMEASLALSSEEAVAGAMALQQLRFGSSLIPAGSDYQSAHDLFATGRLAFTYNGPWSVAHYFTEGVPLTVMPLPDLVDGRPFSGFMSVQGVLVTSDAADPVAAANAAKWLVRSSAQLDLAQRAGRIPASMQAVDALAADEILYGFGMALRNAQAVPQHPVMAAVWQPMGRFLQRLDERVHTEGQIRELLEQAEREVMGE